MVCSQDQAEYQRAYDFYEQANYQQALSRFETLLQQDPQNPAILYNVGLCHQQLKNYEQADFYFGELLADDFYSDWATYQLAINDWRQGYVGAAEIGLMQVVFGSNNADLVELATLQYQLLLREQPSIPPKTFWVNASIAYGRDDNILDSRALFASNQSDNFAEASVHLGRQWLGQNKNDYWQWHFYTLDTRYQNIDDADLQIFSTGLEKSFDINGWQLAVALSYETSRSGGENYLSRPAFSLNLDKNSNINTWALQYEFANSRARDAGFEQLDGDTHEIELQYRRRLTDLFGWKAAVDWSRDDREPVTDLAPQSDLSANRYGFATTGVFASDRWYAELGLRYRDSNYGRITRTLTGAGIDRMDERLSLLGRVEYTLNNVLALYAEYSDTDNDSNVPRFNYQQQVFSAGLSLQF